MSETLYKLWVDEVPPVHTDMQEYNWYHFQDAPKSHLDINPMFCADKDLEAVFASFVAQFRHRPHKIKRYKSALGKPEVVEVVEHGNKERLSEPIPDTSDMWSRELDRTVFKLESFLRLPEPEEGLTNPSWSAINTARGLLSDACSKYGSTLPRTHVAPDGDGGVRLRWRKQRRELKLIVGKVDGSSKSTYIYHQEGSEYNVEYEITPQVLHKWLTWFQRMD